VTRSKDVDNTDALPSIDTVRRYRNPLGHRYPLETDALRERLIAFAARNPPGNREVIFTDEPWLIDSVSSIEKFASFMRFLAPPMPSVDTPGGSQSIARGRTLFGTTGCVACHTPSLRTGSATVAALRNQPVNLYSDLLLHDMGQGLADGITQGQAGPRQFRTAPLWGLGQRLYFLHDGRTSNVLVAIQEHQSGNAANRDASEANTVIGRFNALTEREKQDVLNFLRSL
jgi:mono/diheme cytochrome c family protein